MFLITLNSRYGITTEREAEIDRACKPLRREIAALKAKLQKAEQTIRELEEWCDKNGI